MIGKTISHYKIREKLGEGGMGVVYKAQDIKLNRTVALKFLPSALSADKEARTRFIKEAQAASALDHPNICTIYEIGEAEEGQLFIAMACYEGQTLKERIATNPPTPPLSKGGIKGGLSIDESISIAIQITKGLARAHEEGIIHRDIKPANIMITNRGEVKILDFGLAKLAGQTRLTRTGTTMGTVAYMSPEQARGEEADQRSDIWSLGVVLYEMLSGHLPFKGEFEQAMIYAIINEPSSKVSEIIDDVPPELEKIICKCLAKNPQDRYPSMEELLIDFKPFSTEATITIDESVSGILKRLWRKKKVKRIAVISPVAVIFFIMIGFYFGLFTPSEQIDSLAILPFVNISGNEEGEYLSIGIPESIISDLQKIPNLRLASFSSLLYRYKDKVNDPQTVGQEMNVESVIMGRLSLISDSININLEIIDTRDNSIILAQEYIEKLNNLFEIKTKIARDISEKLPLELSVDDLTRYLPTQKIDPLAYQYYLKGRESTYKRNPESFKKAIFYFNKALEIDSSYALAWSGLADTYSFQPMYSGVSWNRVRPRLIRAAKRAFELDSSLAEIRTSMSAAFNAEQRYNMEVRELKKAISIHPGYIQAYQWLGFTLLTKLGNYEEGIQILKNALEIDPFEPMISGLLALAYIWSGQLEQAEQQNERNLIQNPDHPHTYFAPAWLSSIKGNKEETIKMAQKAVDLDSTNLLTHDFLTSVYEMSGFNDQAIAHYHKMIQQNPEFAYVAHLELSRIYLELGQYDEAIMHCKQSIEIDPLSEEAHQRMGLLHMGMRDYEMALMEFNDCVQVNPNNPISNEYYLMILSVLGRYDEAIEEAIKTSKFDENHLYNLGRIYFCAGEIKKAIENLQKYTDSKNPLVDSYYWLAALYLSQKKYKEAVKNMQIFLARKNFQSSDSCFHQAFDNTRMDETSIINYMSCINYNTTEKKYPKHFSNPLLRAINYALIADTANALNMLDEAEKNKNVGLPVYIKTAFFDNLKSDPRYVSLLKKLRLK